MKNNELLLLRHGKSNSPEGVADDQRPLKGRGRKQATRIGLWLIEQNLLPDFMITSPAVRALSTAEKVCDAIGWPYSAIHVDPRIYEASVEQLLQVLHDLPESAHRVLLIGHNPGLEHLLIHLCLVIDIPEDGKLLPATTLAHLDAGHSWPSLDDDSAQLLSLTRPKSLAEKFPVQTSRGVEYRKRPGYFYTQSAVIPYRIHQHQFEYLLVTTRKGKSWTIPKGIVDRQLSAAASAQNEAREEAGALGELDDTSVGKLRYSKWGGICTVTVFAMQVTELLAEDQWPESYRRRHWVPLDQLTQYIDDDTLLNMMNDVARTRIDEPGL